MTADCFDRVTSWGESNGQDSQINENDAVASMPLLVQNFEEQQNWAQWQAKLKLLNERQMKQKALFTNGKGRESCDIHDQLEEFEKRLDVELHDPEKS